MITDDLIERVKMLTTLHAACDAAKTEAESRKADSMFLFACEAIDFPALHAALVEAKRVRETLTFDEFRAANVSRCLRWHPDGIDSWSPSDWLTAVTGELGELASLLKMRNRERDGLPGNKFSPTHKQIADEIADVFTYLDLLAHALGVDLSKAAACKFNEVSERVGFPERIAVSAESATAAGKEAEHA